MRAALRSLFLVLAFVLSAGASAHVASARGALASTAAHDAALAIDLDAEEEGSIGRGFLRGRTATAAVWTPLTPGNVLGWWDHTDLAHIWADTAGTTSTTNLGAVKRVDDKSGLSVHMTEATNYPTRLDGQANGKTAGAYNGTTARLTTAAFTLPSPGTIIIWCSGPSQTGYAVDSQNNTRGMYYTASAFNAYAGASLTSSVSMTTGVHMIAILFNGASSIINVDGTETSGTTGVNAANMGAILGAAGGNTTFFAGNIYESVWYGIDVGIGGRASARAYGQTKYGAP